MKRNILSRIVEYGNNVRMLLFATSYRNPALGDRVTETYIFDDCEGAVKGIPPEPTVHAATLFQNVPIPILLYATVSMPNITNALVLSVALLADGYEL
jgi:hypothetical protein